ncbi:MAG: hypothetical protein Q8L13_19185 [Bradyrhizobium sp.]|uniref:hypothetical protein n=1 Tax=Bradyrhizobium sp. TaxID=376 RepID=UPI00273046D0|nr:hypothetical protein [Bradyrhizobium sp.]MDP1868447.1 hypothetical protein [Bradyrhizobium sp.]
MTQSATDELRHLAVYDGRERTGSIIGTGRDWRALDARGDAVPGAPFKSQKAAKVALNGIDRRATR